VHKWTVREKGDTAPKKPVCSAEPLNRRTQSHVRSIGIEPTEGTHRLSFPVFGVIGESEMLTLTSDISDFRILTCPCISNFNTKSTVFPTSICRCFAASFQRPVQAVAGIKRRKSRPTFFFKRFLKSQTRTYNVQPHSFSTRNAFLSGEIRAVCRGHQEAGIKPPRFLLKFETIIEY